MPHAAKIATCCYCGTRAQLVLSGKVQHELACSSCGAPLHDLKMLRADHVTDRSGRGKKSKTRREVGATPLEVWEREVPRNKKKKKKPKKRKSFGSRLFDEAFDVLDDIFD